MKKLHLYLAVFSLAVTIVGTLLFPNELMFFMSKDSLSFDLVRGVLLLILISQLLSNPPRRIWFRGLAAITALGVIGWTLYSTYNFIMPAMDTLVFIGSSLVVGVTALELMLEPTSQESAIEATT